MRLPIFTFWLSWASKWPGPRLPDDDAILTVIADPDRISIDIKDRRFRGHLARSIVAKRIGGALAISNSYKQRLIGKLPLIGKTTGNLRYLRRFRLPFEIDRQNQGFLHGFDALVVAIGPVERRMSIEGFAALKGKCVRNSLEAGGWSWLEFYRTYIK